MPRSFQVGTSCKSNHRERAMEQLIAMVAFAILGIGLIAAVMGLIGFTRWFDTSAHESAPDAAAKGERPA